MKVALSDDKSKKSQNSQLLPLVPDAMKEHTKDNSIQLELMTDPANPNTSPKYKMMFFVLNGDEDVRTIVQWQQDLLKVYHGLNIQDALNRSLMAESLLKGTAKMLFRNELNRLSVEIREAAAVAAQNAQGAAADAGDTVRQEALSRHINLAAVSAALDHMLTEIMPRRVCNVSNAICDANAANRRI